MLRSDARRPQLPGNLLGDPRYAMFVWSLATITWVCGFPAFLFATKTAPLGIGSCVYLSWGLLSAAAAPTVVKRRTLPVLLPVGTAMWCGSLGFVDVVYRQTAPVVLVALFAMTGLVYGRSTLLPVGTLSICAATAAEFRAFQEESVTRLVALVLSLAIVGALVVISTKHEDDLRAQISQLVSDLRDRSETDELTGVLNRRGLREHLRHLDPSAGRRWALFLVDVDRFKEINDTLGHDAGDAVLKVLANRLDTFRSEGLVARLGGDEFVAILDLGGSSTIDNLVRQIEVGLAEPVRTVNRLIPVSASVGGVAFSAGEDLAVVLAAADAQMYSQKRSVHRRGSKQHGDAVRTLV